MSAPSLLMNVDLMKGIFMVFPHLYPKSQCILGSLGNKPCQTDKGTAGFAGTAGGGHHTTTVGKRVIWGRDGGRWALDGMWCDGLWCG